MVNAAKTWEQQSRSVSPVLPLNDLTHVLDAMNQDSTEEAQRLGAWQGGWAWLAQRAALCLTPALMACWSYLRQGWRGFFLSALAGYRSFLVAVKRWEFGLPQPPLGERSS